MSVEGLRQRAGLVLLQPFDLFEKRGQGLWVVTRLVQILDPEKIRLRLETASEPQEPHGYGNTSKALRRIANSAAHKNQRDGSQLHQLSTRVFPSQMTSGNMCD